MAGGFLHDPDGKRSATRLLAFLFGATAIAIATSCVVYMHGADPKDGPLYAMAALASTFTMSVPALAWSKTRAGGLGLPIGPAVLPGRMSAVVGAVEQVIRPANAGGDAD